MKSDRGRISGIETLPDLRSQQTIWKTRHDERHRLNTSNKSTQSGGSSPHMELECEESLEGIQIQCSAIEIEIPIIPPQRSAKSSSSFIQEIHGTQPPPPSDYADLEIEEEPDPLLWSTSTPCYQRSLLENELDYTLDSNSFDSRQPYISPMMRTILLDWMMEVCSEFTLKRETFHKSVYYVDKFIASYPGIRKQEFQLIGVTAMYLASKTEEIYSPKITDFAKSADNGYSIADIRGMEKLIMNRLGWRVYPATACNWTSWLMNQWDNFMDYHFGCVKFNNIKDFDHLPLEEKKEQLRLFENRFITFKYANQPSYKRFRETMQILDSVTLDHNIRKHSARKLSAGLLYLMISKFFFESGYVILYYNGPEYTPKLPQYESLLNYFGERSEDFEDSNCSNNYENASIVQDLYTTFIAAAAELRSIDEIYPSVAFIHPYLDFPFNYDLPVVCKTQSKARLESHYEEFLSYQTHNICNVEFITAKHKNLQ
jgi:hypothetical protein